MYTKEGCHLCERVLDKLAELNSEGSFTISTQDITKSKKLFEHYRYLIPVVEIDGKVTLAGTALSNASTMIEVLRRAIFSSKE